MTTFTELTYTDEEAEFMLHRGPRGGVLAIYTYTRDVPSFVSEDRHGNLRTPYQWLPGKNPLFVHLPKGSIRRFVAEFVDSKEFYCSEDE